MSSNQLIIFLPHNVIILSYSQNIIFQNQSPRKGLGAWETLTGFCKGPYLNYIIYKQ